LAGSDDALEIIALNRKALATRFRLDISNPSAQLCMLDKLDTYRAAQVAGVPTPQFWIAESQEHLQALRPLLAYPLIVKPRSTHRFQMLFGAGGRKFFTADGFDDLLRIFQTITEAQLEVLLVEKIPGADDQLCSYYTYIDESGRHLFDFTKRIIRRYPANMGPATYHVTDHNPALRPLAEKLFRQVGLLGLANVEFKRDARDGQLKLIECNARFTAANCLVAASGLDLARFVYHRLTGHPHELPASYVVGRRLWYPIDDLRAYLELRSTGQLGLLQWIRSVLHRQVLPYFDARDPLPSWRGELSRAHKVARSWLSE
jgi:predicted ATP-grasp superfamily ATP-dependent carboligase